MGSTRFPGKMMADLDGEPVIWHVLDRVKKAKLVDKVILATSKDNKNDILEKESKKNGVIVFRGSEEDVLDRFYQTAKKHNAKIIVRITGDCPLIDPEIIDETINFFKDNNCDYASNTNPPTYPDGMDVEVFSVNSLETAWKNAKLKSEREHVTLYIRNNEDNYKIENLENDQDLSHYRLTLDEKEDLIVIQKILKKLKDKTNFGLSDIVKVIESNPEILEINKKYNRNEGLEKSLKEDKIVK